MSDIDTIYSSSNRFRPRSRRGKYLTVETSPGMFESKFFTWSQINERYRRAFKRMSGVQSGMDDAGAANERSEARTGAVQASRTPCQSARSHPAGAHAPVGDDQLTLF